MCCVLLSFSLGTMKVTTGIYYSHTQIYIYTSSRSSLLMKFGHRAGSEVKMQSIRHYRDLPNLIASFGAS